MAESKSASVVFTNGSLLAKNAQAAASSAKSTADNAYNLAYSAQKTADGKNSIYRGSDPNTVPKAGLKKGDLYFTDNALYTWTGTSWEKTVSDTTGAEIHAKVEKAMAESQKAVAEFKSSFEAKVKKLDDEIAQTEIKTGNALNFYKEQYYLSNSYTELVGGSWSDEVPPRKVKGKYVWSRYVTANIGDPTNKQYSDPVCISGLDGETGPQGPQGVPGPKGADGQTTYVHVAYANSADGKSNFSVNYFADALYIGVLTDHTQADSTDYTQYTWSRLKGDAGDQGIPGPKGADGRTTYVHFAYANITQLGWEYTDFTLPTQAIVRFGNEDLEKWIYKDLPAGKYTASHDYFGDPAYGQAKAIQVFSDFSVTESSGRAYIGQYTDFTQADSTDPASYKWTKIKGETGPTGATGPKGDTGDTGFFIGTTPPPNPAKGTVWATNDSSGHMNSAKRWDGSNWVSTAFTQDLVAGNISATKIVGGELDVNKITVKNAQNIPITSTVSLGDKLSDIEQNANGISTTVRNLHAGDRNLARGVASSKDWATFNSFSSSTNLCFDLVSYSLDTLKVGDKVTFGITIKNEGVTSGSMYFQEHGDVSVWNRDYNAISPASNVTDFVPNGTEKALTYTITITDGMLDGNSSYIVQVRTDNVPSGGKLSFRYAYIKKGTLATDWTPAPEDVDDSVSQVKQTADSINAYVKGSRGSDTLKAILSMDPNNSSIAQVVNGQIAAAIGTYSDGSVRIDGKALYINSHAKIDDATIKSAMIDSIEANKIKSGTLDASQIRVINLDANSITTGSLSAVVNDLRKFETFVVSPSNTWNFDYIKSSYGDWFLIGEISADHVYNGPKDVYGNKLTPYMYVTSRGSADGTRFTVTVWKDNDPTQYQRVWNGSSWSDWVMLPNSQNLISAINLSPDSVKISGKNIELNGNTRIADGFTLSADKIRAGTLNGVTITGSKFIANTDNGNLYGTLWKKYQVVVDNTEVNIHGTDSSSNDWEAILTSNGLFLQMANDNNTWIKSIDISIVGQNPHINLVNSGPNPGNYSSTYIGSDGVRAPIGQLGNWSMQGSKVLAQSGSLYVANPAGNNFDDNGSVGFQVWGGIGLGKSTIYMPGNDLYIQQGNCGPGLGQRYSAAGKVDVHCNRVISQRANTVSSRLSLKTDITPVSYDRALAAVEGTEMYDYRYVSDDSGQHYVSGIIDDVNPDPQYHMDDMLINKERTARIDSNLVGYHHVIIQKLLERVAALEEKVK